MNREIRSYLKAEAIISGAFNFFITGMCAALIHHKADYIPADIINIAIDEFIICLCIGILTALFGKASLKRTKFLETQTGGGSLTRFLSRLFRHAALFGILLGLVMFLALFALTVPILILFSITEIPFSIYIPLKCVLFGLMSAGATALELFSGIHKGG